ncbi:MAG TPA: trans-aconitate 2-methyltransferase [Polyangiaceae bacterium]|nr:trans-aconitate 2-methyltransferase [Polyangiaceae bacterium]
MKAANGMPTWDNQQYLKFADERTRAAAELLARVPLTGAEEIVDLGCGPGNSTALLHERFASARVVGVDSSADMLARARADYPKLAWVRADAANFESERPLDLLFANALLQWVPDHATVVPSLFAQLRPGGALAFQVPRNFEEPSHRLMRSTPGPWLTRLTGVRSATPVESPAFYYDLLAPAASSVDIWQTTYEHVMPTPSAIVEWVKGTGLRPYLEALPEGERAAYLAAYTQGIDAAYPARRDGQRLFSFPRLFVVAVRR